jgi:hypothetical protein
VGECHGLDELEARAIVVDAEATVDDYIREAPIQWAPRKEEDNEEA